MWRWALAVGEPHPDFITRRVTPRQADDARRYFMREPWGAAENHRLLANLVVLVSNALRKKGGQAVKMRDVMPGKPPPRRGALAANAREWLMSTGKAGE